MAQRASTGRAGVVSPSTLDTPHTGEDAKRRNVWPLLAVAAIIALLSTNGLAWYLLYSDDPPPPSPSSTVPAFSTTANPVPAESDPPIIDLPENGVYGTFSYRGNPQLTGEADGGFRTLLGRYWEPVAPGGFLQSDLVSYGRFLYVASETHNAVYALDQSDGTTRFTLETDGHTWTGPVVAQFTRSLGPEGTETVQRLIAASEDGTLYSRNALGSGTTGWWTRELNESIRAAPMVVDGKIIIATADGSILALGADGEDLWRYPTARTDRPAFRHSPAIAGGVLHAVDERGFVHLVSVDTGLPVCAPIPTSHGPSAPPMVTDGLVIFGTDGATVVLEIREDCRTAPRLIRSQVDTPLAPAYADHRLFSVEGASLVAWRITKNDEGSLEPISLAWDAPYQAESRISTAPIVADGVVYFGTNDGVVHAVDAKTKSTLWTFDTGERVHGGPVISTNAIFVTTEREIFAIAGE